MRATANGPKNSIKEWVKQKWEKKKSVLKKGEA